jgi:hypothetical protein
MLDDFVWGEVSRLLANPGLVRVALEAEIEELQAREAELKRDLERIGRELDRLATERQWVIAQARKGNISEADMVAQLQEVDLQLRALAKEREEKAALAAYRQRAEELAAFAEEYLSEVREGLAWLNQDLTKADAETKRRVFEAKREIVRTLVERVIVHRGRPPEVKFAIELPELLSEEPLEVSGVSNGCPLIGQ